MSCYVLSLNIYAYYMLSNSKFCTLAHYLGETSFEDKHTPCVHSRTALLPFGEGHNFQHQFSTDFGNAVQWYQYDPTKWFIIACQKPDLAMFFRRFLENEIQKGQLVHGTSQTKDSLGWPQDSLDSPVINWKSGASFAMSTTIQCRAQCG